MYLLAHRIVVVCLLLRARIYDPVREDRPEWSLYMLPRSRAVLCCVSHIGEQQTTKHMHSTQILIGFRTADWTPHACLMQHMCCCCCCCGCCCNIRMRCDHDGWYMAYLRVSAVGSMAKNKNNGEEAFYSFLVKRFSRRTQCYDALTTKQLQQFFNSFLFHLFMHECGRTILITGGHFLFRFYYFYWLDL